MFSNIYRHVDNQDRPDIPSYPALTLLTHCLMKGLQSGAVLGLIAIPILRYRSGSSFSAAWKRSMVISPIVGCSITTALLLGKDMNGGLTDDSVDDRAYRIKHNEGQVKVDKYSIITGCGGAVIGSVFVGGGVLASTSTGIAFGVLYYIGEGHINSLKETVKKSLINNN